MLMETWAGAAVAPPDNATMRADRTNISRYFWKAIVPPQCFRSAAPIHSDQRFRPPAARCLTGGRFNYMPIAAPGYARSSWIRRLAEDGTCIWPSNISWVVTLAPYWA